MGNGPDHDAGLGQPDNGAAGIQELYTDLLNLFTENTFESKVAALRLLVKIIGRHEFEADGDPSILQNCWDAIPAEFLDTLLEPDVEFDIPKKLATMYVDLAASILEYFADTPIVADVKFGNRATRLLSALDSR